MEEPEPNAPAEEPELEGLARSPSAAPHPGDPGSAPARSAARRPRAAGAAAEPRLRLVAGRYERLGLLREGPSGRVFRVRDHAAEGREVALLILPSARTAAPGFEARLQGWIERRRALEAHGVERLRDVGRTELGLTYLTTDATPGASLRDVLSARGALHPRHALEIERRLARTLEHAHAAGMPHGALDEGSVLLLDRVPSTDENPFGVDVRLLDHGLAELLADEGAEPAPESDVAAAGRLLVRMLSGTAPDVGADPGPLPAGLSPELRTLARRASRPPAGGGFGSAGELRAALDVLEERVPAGKGAAGPWRAATLVLALLLVSSLGLFAWRTRRPLAPVQAAAPDPTTAADPLADELEGARARLAEAEARAADATATHAALDEEKARSARLGEQLDALGKELASWKQRAQDGAARADRLADEVGAARTHGTQLESELAGLRRSLQEARDQSRLRELELRPDYAAARLFDRVLAAAPLEAGTVLGQGEGEGVLVARSWPGRDFVTALGDARADLARAHDAEDLAERSDLLEHARAGAAGLRAGRDGFARAAAGWLSIATDLEAEPARLAAVDRALDELDHGIAEERERLAPALDERWSALRAGSPDLPPESVLAVTRWSDGGRLAAWLEGYAAWLQRTAGAGERLDEDALRSVQSLDAWADVVAQSPALTASTEGREVLLFAWARRFLDPAHADESLPPGPVFPQGPGGGSPLSGWRAKLAQEARLLAPGSGFPGQPGSRALYFTRTREGELSWQLETLLADPSPPADATRSVVVQQSFYDTSGRFLQERKVRRVLRGKRLYEEGVRQVLLLDLGRQDGCSLGYWTPEELPDVPDRLPVRLQRIVAFRKDLLAHGWPCLIAPDGTALTWTSPDLGLVRRDDPEAIVRELVWVGGTD